MANREVHLELLLGQKLLDSKGDSIGRVEEVIAERQGDEWVVREYLVGRTALLHRFSIRGMAKAVLGFFGAKENAGYRVSWDKLDLSDPEKLCLHCAKDELDNV